jgi:hypothetical protein
MNLERLSRMGVREVAVRGWQGASRLLEPVSGLPSRADREAAGSLSLEEFRDGMRRRFFEGAVDGPSSGLLRRRMPDAVARVMEVADEARAGRFDLLGYRGLSFGDPLDWNLDPVSGRRAPAVSWQRIRPLAVDQVGDSKVIWELGRHQWLVNLAQAYRLTGEESYAESTVSFLRDFVRSNPPRTGIHWASSLEAALRIVSWCWILALLRLSKALSAEVLADLVATISAHAHHVERYLSHYFSPNTHLTGEALGLFYAGVLFPELPSAERWRERGARLLAEQSARQVLEDGVYFEQSTYYQRYTLEIYLHFMILARRNDFDVPKEIGTRVEKMLDFLLTVRPPDGSDPRIGDADGGSLLPLVPRPPGDTRGVSGVGAALFHRSDYAWAAGGAPSEPSEVVWLLGPKGYHTLTDLGISPPAKLASRAFPEGGYVVMASGWQADAHHLVFDVGPLGCPVSSGHGHADLLSIQCSPFGEPFLVDPGTFTYTPEPMWRDYFRSSLAHSTVVVDGRSQADTRGPFAWASRPRARLRRWLSTADYDLADADHEAYGRLPRPVGHRRRVVFVKPRYWVIADDLRGAGEHRVELRFQFAPLDVEVLEETWVRARSSSGRGLLMRSSGVSRLDLGVHRGETDPPRGWVSPNYGQKVPAPMVIFSAVVSLPVRLLTLLLPVADAGCAPPDVMGVGDDGVGPIGLDVGGETVLLHQDGVALL